VRFELNLVPNIAALFGGLSAHQHRILEIPDLILGRGMAIVPAFAVLFLSTSFTCGDSVLKRTSTMFQLSRTQNYLGSWERIVI
jgi:hypothetical protein